MLPFFFLFPTSRSLLHHLPKLVQQLTSVPTAPNERTRESVYASVRPLAVYASCLPVPRERERARTNERLYRRFKFKVFFITITLSPPREIHTPSRSGGRKQRKTSLIVVRPSVRGCFAVIASIGCAFVPAVRPSASVAGCREDGKNRQRC